jgi:hypothetical protein
MAMCAASSCARDTLSQDRSRGRSSGPQGTRLLLWGNLARLVYTVARASPQCDAYVIKLANWYNSLLAARQGVLREGVVSR